MISLLFYITYFVLMFCAFTPFILRGKYAHVSLIPFLFFPQFNVTCFLKLGLTISFFELYMFLFIFLITLAHVRFTIKITRTDRIFFVFLFLSFISILVAQFRIAIADLIPSIYIEPIPLLRSFMSMNRFLVYPIIFVLIRNFYKSRNVNINKYFKLYLAFSGVFPSLASLLEFSDSNFMLFFNNPSFAMDEGWLVVSRPCGLTNEASFFAYQLFFSFIGVYFSVKEKYLNKNIGYILYALYLTSVVVSASRTGLVVIAVWWILKNYKHITLKKVALIALVGGCFMLVSVLGTSVWERVMSTFDTEADMSTIERYGVTEALLSLTIDKGLILGVGIYNYVYYIRDYLPDSLLLTISYQKDYAIPSFNFILQLWTEWGSILFLIYVFYVRRQLKRINNQFVKDWFLFLTIFGLSFQILNFSLPFIIMLYDFKIENYARRQNT